MQVFLSHSSKDKQTARRIAKGLKSHGVDVWIDEAEIRVGDSLVQTIASAVHGVDYIVALISNNSVASPWVTKELRWAMGREIESSELTVLPIILDDCPIPDYLQDKLYASFVKPRNYGALVSRLLTAMDFAQKNAELPSTKNVNPAPKKDRPALHCFVTGFAFGRAVTFLVTPDRHNEKLLVEFSREMGLTDSEASRLEKALAQPAEIETLPVRLDQVRQASQLLKSRLNDFEANWFVLGELLPKLPMARPLMGLIGTVEELGWNLRYAMGRLNIGLDAGIGVDLEAYRLAALNDDPSNQAQLLRLLDSLPGNVAASIGFVEPK